MRAFLTIKYYDDSRNRKLIEDISQEFKNIGIDTFVFVRDVENWGPWNGTATELMERAFLEIEKSDILIVEASETSIGVGMEACYAHLKGIPVYTIAKKGAYVSDTVKGISKKFFEYNAPEDLQKFTL